MRRQLGRRGDILGIGIERIDYTKGNPRAVRGGLDRPLFERHPRIPRALPLTFVQVGSVPSRGRVVSYQLIDKEIDRLVEHAQLAIGYAAMAAGRLLQASFFAGRDDHALHRLANFCIVEARFTTE